MTKHMPETPDANRSHKGAGDRHEIRRRHDTRRTFRCNKRIGTRQLAQHHAEHNEQRPVPRAQDEVARMFVERRTSKAAHPTQIPAWRGLERFPALPGSARLDRSGRHEARRRVRTGGREANDVPMARRAENLPSVGNGTCAMPRIEVKSDNHRFPCLWLCWARLVRPAGRRRSRTGGLAQDASPFAGLAGKWSGDGSIALTNGTTERLRCDANYVVSGGGDNLDLTLRCASDSYNFDLRISLVNNGGRDPGKLERSHQECSGRDFRHGFQRPHPGERARSNLRRRRDGRDPGPSNRCRIRAQSGDCRRSAITLHHAH